MGGTGGEYAPGGRLESLVTGGGGKDFESRVRWAQLLDTFREKYFRFIDSCCGPSSPVTKAGGQDKGVMAYGHHAPCQPPLVMNCGDHGAESVLTETRQSVAQSMYGAGMRHGRASPEVDRCDSIEGGHGTTRASPHAVGSLTTARINELHNETQSK